MNQPSQGEARPFAGLLPLLLPILLFAFLAALFWQPMFDDAYISMRYARNWADGLGLVFNPGERVEGFSDPLWVALLALAAKLGLPIEDTARLLGGLAAAAVVGICAALRQPGNGRAAAFIAAILLAASGEFAYYAVAGLETTLFSLIITGLALCWQPHPSRARAGALIGLALLAALTRPEGALIFAVVGGAAAAINWRAPRVWRAPLGAAAAIAGGLLAARWFYYGALLPNTYLAKPFVASFAYFRSSLQLIAVYFLVDWRFLLIPPALAAVLIYRRQAWAQAVAVLAGFGLFFLFWSGGHPRFFTPYLPALYLLTGAGLALLLQRRRWRVIVTLAVLALLAVSCRSAFQRAQYLYAGGRDPSGHSFAHAGVGRWLNENTPADASIIGWEIGAIGFYSERRILDTQGLVDREVATLFHANGHNPYIYWIDPAQTRTLGIRVLRILLDRGAGYALLEYHGDPVAPFDPEQVIPRYAYNMVVEEEGFMYVKLFVLDATFPKSFILFQSPAVNLEGLDEAPDHSIMMRKAGMRETVLKRNFLLFRVPHQPAEDRLACSRQPSAKRLAGIPVQYRLPFPEN